jgi:hypothetical protein
MPKLGKGTECIQILLTQASKDMHEPLVPMLFPVLDAHISSSEFQFLDFIRRLPMSKMANLMGDSGSNKGQLPHLVVAIVTSCEDYLS